MSVLVTYASKQGATRRIAERIGVVLRDRGLAVEVRPLKAMTDPAEYEAVVVGSAVYDGSWLKEATSFIERNQPVLDQRPVWFFSSLRLGDSGGPQEFEPIAAAVSVREHRVFPDTPDHMKFDMADLMVWGLPRNRRLLIEGDFRAWPDVEKWAASIADQLEHEFARTAAKNSVGSTH